MNRHGGDVTVVHLPELGIRGNTHFPMSDLNSPFARSAWHVHPLGQVFIVTAGVGRVQQWGQPIDEIRAGDVVRIPPNTKHWHGAAPAAGQVTAHCFWI